MSSRKVLLSRIPTALYICPVPHIAVNLFDKLDKLDNLLGK